MRDKQIDILKAIGIIFVVAGHSSSPLFNWIYSFHMPLFFFVSGFLRYSSQSKPWGKFLIGKIKASLLPYFVFWFISVIIFGNLKSLITTREFASFGLDQIKGLILGGHWLADFSNNFPLWYLQLFFIAVIIFEIIARYFHPILKVVTFFALCLVTIPFQNLLPGRPVFHINVLPAALSFMLLGYFVSYLVSTKNVKILKSNLAVGGLMLALGFLVSSLQYGNISKINSLLYFVAAFCTITGFYILAGKLVKSKILSYVGSNTLYIMGLHILAVPYSKQIASFILEKFETSNALILNLLSTVICIVICCGVIEIYKYIKEISAHLFKKGNLNKKQDC